MNAHTVAEVLNRVTGLFVDFNAGYGRFGSASLMSIQASEPRHVLVLVDGIKWNFANSGAAETNTIPVGIIERIEVVKGPASSAWGSSLGGVIHIITKAPGYASGPSGSARASYGEHDTRDFRAQVSGRTGKFGYYLFGGRQASTGVDDARDLENNSYYSKFVYALSDRVNLNLSLGHSQPDTGLGNFDIIDITSSGETRTFWGTALLDAAISRDWTFSLRLFNFRQKPEITNRSLGLGPAGPRGEIYRKLEFDERTTGATAKLVRQSGSHTTVVGVDYETTNMDQAIYSGQSLQAMGAQALFRSRPDIDRTGVFLNHTAVLNRLSITPGIRYDRNSITDSFISPSLGIVYRLRNDTILRGAAARGFASPALSWISGGALFLEPNPSLKEERVVSFQAGLETSAIRYVWINTTLFRHEIDEIFGQEFTGKDSRGIDRRFINNGDSRRQGVELEIETLPFHHISLTGGTVYVDLDPANRQGATEMYAHTVGIVYDDPKICRAELYGSYTWWDEKTTPHGEHRDFIWDLNIRKKVYKGPKTAVDLFCTAHNLFNGSHYSQPSVKNPDRWVEAGLKLEF